MTTYHNATVAPLAAFRDKTMGQTFALAIGPGCIVKSWCDAGRPTVRVEKGYGSGVFQDLYPYTDGKLYTGPWGTGTEASVWAGASKLLVEKPYNQCASDLVTGHPVKLADNKRVLLDLSTPNAPFFAGYSTGTQDASQHATQRGYSISQVLQTNAYPMSIIALHAHAAAETVYLIQDSATGTTKKWESDPGNLRHFTWDVAVSKYLDATVPNVIAQWGVDDGRGIGTEYSIRPQFGGIVNGLGFLLNTSSTSYALNVMGPTNSLQGKLYALMIATAAIAPSAMLFPGIPARLHDLCKNGVVTNKPSVVYPYSNAVVPMNLSTQRADIPIKLFGKPSTSYEASWQGGAYATIGTTNENGYLNGALTNQLKGNGTLNVREVGSATPQAITNVAVGIVMVVMGESDPDGRNDNVTITIPTGSLRQDRTNWTTTSNEWWKLVCQGLYDYYGGVVIATTKATQGSTLFKLGSNEGHWSVNNTTYSPHMATTGTIAALGLQVDQLTPNFWLFEIGKNDAAQLTSQSDFSTRFSALLSAYKTRLNNSNLSFDVTVFGPNAAAAANADAIRQGVASLVDGTNFKMAGSFAHLPTTEVAGVHLKTQAEKQAAANIVLRHWIGQGRAPRYLSAVKSTNTITITLQGGVSPMTISSSSDVTGWTVTDGSGANAVTAVNVSGMDVTLTLTRNVSGTATVKWASGTSAVGTTLKDSGSTTPLPPEPFEITV